MDKKINFFKIIDYITCFLLILLSIKKGGFYKSDVIFFNLGINIIAVISIIVSYLKNNTKKEKNKLSILLLMFSLAYLLPVILKNYSSLNDSIFEMIRYFNLYLIYFIVRKSENKEIYKTCIIIIAVILVFLGIDQIACGYMTNILNVFDSGYLTSNNIDRMSSTIQYANVFAIICLIAYIFCVKKIYEKILKVCLNNLLQVILLSGVILSGSRTVILITFILILYSIIKNKKIAINLITNLIYTSIYTIIISKLITNNLIMIYIITLIAYILNLLFSYVVIKYDFNITKYLLKIKNKKHVTIISICCIIVFFIVVFNTFTSINLNSSSNKSYVTRNIYDIDKENDNLLKIKIDELEEDTRYEIEVFEVYYNNESRLLDKLYYYSTTTGEFNIQIKKNANIKYININVNCTKGSLKIENILLNDKRVVMDYLLLPSNLVYRIKDGICNSNRYNYRFVYQKDALKIITNTFKNFVFGCGGETFRNEYKYFKNVDYNSTEVHNIYIQMWLESGVLGLAIFILIIIYILKKYKLNSQMLAVICILIHGIFDLNFSYMIIIAIFGVLLGILEEKECNSCENKNEKQLDIKNNVIEYVEKILGISLWTVTTIILIFSNIASNTKVYEITEYDSIDKIRAKVVNYEKITNLDIFEPKYRLKLNDAYSVYLNKLNEGEIYNNQNEYINIINNMLINLEYMNKNESKNTSNLISISNQYFNNIDYFVKLNNDTSDNNYEYYLNIVYSNMEKLCSCNDRNLKITVENICDKYINNLKKLDNDIANKYIKLLENMIGI